jgi:hypothetical protein
VLYYSKRANAATGNHWKLDEQIKTVQFKHVNSRTHDNSVKVVQNTTLSVWTNDMIARSKARVFNSGTLGSWYRIPLRHWYFSAFLWLCCHVKMEALRRADSLSEESCQVS